MLVNKIYNNTNATNLNSKNYNETDLDLYLYGLVSTNKLSHVATRSVIDGGKRNDVKGLLEP